MNVSKIVVERENKVEYVENLNDDYEKIEERAIHKAIALRNKYPQDEIRVYLGIYKNDTLIKQFPILLFYRKD
jgi:hypothetical protein